MAILSDNTSNHQKFHSFQEAGFQREARISAIQAIRSISNWLYWRSPKAGAATTESHQNLSRITQKSADPNINKLHEAAAARKRALESTRSIQQAPSKYIYHDEYWIPSTQPLPASINGSSFNSTLEASQANESKNMNEKVYRVGQDKHWNPIRWEIPMVIATIAAVTTRLQIGEGSIGGLNAHIGGSLALEIVNSSWLQVTLAGITWYIIGMAMIGLVEAVRNRL